MATGLVGTIKTNTLYGGQATLEATVNGQTITDNGGYSSVSFYINIPYAWFSHYGDGIWCQVIIDGNVEYNHGITGSGGITFYKDIQHNPDGTKSISVQLKFAVGKQNVYNATGSGIIQLPTIAKQTTATCPAAVIGHDHSIVINKAQQSFTTTLKYKVYKGNKAIIQTIVEKTSASNVIGIPAALLYDGIASNAKSTTAYLICEGFDGNTSLGETETEFVLSTDEEAAKPDVYGLIKDLNSKTIALTGDATKLIRYASRPSITVHGTPKYGAAIAESRITYQNQTYIGSEVTISPEYFVGDYIVVGVTDTRGLIASERLHPNIINYIPLTARLVADVASVGKVSLTFSGDYFDGSFGAQHNSLSIKYRYNDTGWITVTPDISNNSYFQTVTIENLDYTQGYTFEYVVTDKIKEINGEESIRFIPVFDWGKDDFEFNVPVAFNKGVIGDAFQDNRIRFGAWSPSVITPDLGGTAPFQLTTREGFYFKVGDVVTVTFRIAGQITHSESEIKVTNLPYSPKDGGFGAGAINNVGPVGGQGWYFSGWETQGGNIIGLMEYPSNNVFVQRPSIKVVAGKAFTLQGTVTYQVSE